MKRRELVFAAATAAVVPAARMARASPDDTLAAGADVPGLRAIVVARGGALIAERYYGAANENQLQSINSATKSVVSLLVGQALAQGKLRSLDQTVAELLPEAAGALPGSPAAALTLRHILNGTTGLEYDFIRQFPELARAADPVRYVLELPRASEPGQRWSYNDAAISLLAPILERAQGMSLQDLARRDLAGPLGITQVAWEHDTAGRRKAYAGMRLRPRDFVKLAGLAAGGGAWDGKQVVPREWMLESTQPAVPATWRLPPVEGVGYGRLWFTGTLRGQPIAWGWGYGGQFAWALPSQGLAIATAATSPFPQQLDAQTRAISAFAARVVDALA